MFIILNQQLINAAEKDDLEGFKNLVLSFSFKKNTCEDSIQVLPYKDSFLSSTQWEYYHFVMTPGGYSDAVFLPPSKESFARSSSLCQKALLEIKNVAPTYYAEVQQFVSHILIVHSDKFEAGSSFDVLGLITFIESLDFRTLVEHIVHETAHQYLYNVMTFDQVCSGEGLYESPLRKDPRPLEGIYHATFVLARIIDFYKHALKNNSSLPKEHIKKQVDHYL